jgi:hypothetical protein
MVQELHTSRWSLSGAEKSGRFQNWTGLRLAYDSATSRLVRDKHQTPAYIVLGVEWRVSTNSKVVVYELRWEGIRDLFVKGRKLTIGTTVFIIVPTLDSSPSQGGNAYQVIHFHKRRSTRIKHFSIKEPFV